MKMKEKVVIITGGGKGIGRGVAEAFGEEGANLVITGRHQESLDQAKQELEKLNQSSQKGMDVSTKVKENTIIYTFKYDKTFTDKEKGAMAEYFEKYLDTAASTFQSIAKEMEEKSEIKGVKVRITYKNGDDSEIYNREFDAGK